VAKKAKLKTELGKISMKEEKQRRFLEKLGFVQMVFDFYTSPVA
jgi:hypothetical protein